ncbi:MAG: hypothetical protein FVQ81_17880, partial [Candidatus Glassbacteria bacterium]|nr:hypothetical protein [Candidatus Glassbacteria bacterium]
MTLDNTAGGSDKSRPPDRDGNGEGLIFSQNLELDFLAAGQESRPVRKPEPEAESSPAEREIYFRLEAAKVVDLLRGELERFGASDGVFEMVEELWRSWLALWGDGRERGVAEFTELFRVAHRAFEAAVERGADEFSAPEKLALGRLMQAMERLVAGEVDDEDIAWCTEAGYRVARMIAAWNSGGQPEPDQAHESAELAAVDDISGSIDEWFSQVSRFIPQLHDDEPEEASMESDGESVFSAREIQPSLEAHEDDIDLEHVRELDPAGTETPGARVEAEPVAGLSVVPPVEDKRRVAGQEKTGSGGREEIVLEGTSEGWLAEVYFSECCLEAVEAIRSNVDYFEGHSARRTARIFGDHVDYLIQLSRDFGITE